MKICLLFIKGKIKKKKLEEVFKIAFINILNRFITYIKFKIFAGNIICTLLYTLKRKDMVQQLEHEDYTQTHTYRSYN